MSPSSAEATLKARVPMTTPSSTSQSAFVAYGGSSMGSVGPEIVEGILKKMTGRSGGSAPASRACAA
jgi:hypothetical protein